MHGATAGCMWTGRGWTGLDRCASLCLPPRRDLSVARSWQRRLTEHGRPPSPRRRPPAAAAAAFQAGGQLCSPPPLPPCCKRTGPVKQAAVGTGSGLQYSQFRSRSTRPGAAERASPRRSWSWSGPLGRGRRRRLLCVYRVCVHT